MANFFRELRIALGDSQQKFAERLGIALSSVQNYEGGKKPERPILERMIKVALQHNLSTLAAEFQKMDQGGSEYTSRYPAFRHQTWHEALDEVLDSGNPRAITAVESSLRVSQDYIRGRSDPRKKAGK